MRNPLTAIDPELLAQGDAIIQCDKHRHGEWEGRIKLWFHAPSLQYVANESGRPFEMVRL
jgi:twinkle protein